MMAGRGNNFSRSEKEYVVAKCLKVIRGETNTRDEDIANLLGRSKNNISILRRNLGFAYQPDPKTNEIKLFYSRPSDLRFQVNIENLDVDKIIIFFEEKIKRSKLNKDEVSDNDEYTNDDLVAANNELIDKNDNVNETLNLINNNVGFEVDESEADSRFDDAQAEEMREYTSDEDVNSISEKEENDEFNTPSFLMIKSGFYPDEWDFFKSRWRDYVSKYEGQFNIAEDFDDLIGLISEIVMRQRLLKKQKIDGIDYTKELSENSKRMSTYKGSLSTSRHSRLNRNIDEAVNIAQLVEIFEDDKRYIELVLEAEKEIDEIIDWVNKNLENPKTEEALSKVTGNESNLLIGLDINKLRDILDAG